MTTALTRRHLLQATSIGAGALAGASLLPRGAFAADEVVAAAYPGSFEESYAEVLVPLFRDATGAEVILTPLLAMEQVAKITASRGNPPLDVALLDEGPMLQSLSLDIFEPFPAEKSRNHADLLASFQSEQWGPTVTVQLIGIAYNPTKIQTPPTSWMDLWKPEYKGRVGLTTMESSLGTVFVVEIAKLHGGSRAGEPQPRTRSRRGSASRPWVVVSATNRGSNPACRQ